MNNTQLKNIGSKVLAKANISEDEKFGSVIAILMIISIILTVIRVLQECNKNKLSASCTAADKCSLYGAEIKEYSIRRGWFTKMRIKKILRRELSPEQYNKYSLALLNALLDTGENLNNEEISCLVEAANV
ncbi:hypothetical protein EB118_21925 [bacterium]|nr:hypothetical protein [bacterium]NDC96063.1 hypothetical protein [bacterium]NDD84772.1 hypothetical protein [bacterium]NDG32720.1 hypothetical protein [bacterium]